MAYIAGTSAVAPLGPRLLLETFKLTNAPLALLALWMSKISRCRIEILHERGQY